MKQATYQLEIDGLTIGLPAQADRALAVDGVTLGVRPNEIVCVVGESGSGKSVMARSAMGLLSPGLRPLGGAIRLGQEDVLQASAARLRQIRGAEVGMIFQEPMTALNPLMTCGAQINEMLREHQPQLSRAARRQKVLSMIEQVHLPDPAAIHGAYPHEISGGQRQRVMIAMALVLDPKVLIADEPTTALDVTSQAQVLTLIRELQRKRQTSVLFITHDFGVVAQIADRVAVMQQGQLVELGSARQVLTAPEHPYTRALIAAVPRLALRAPSVAGTAEPAVRVKDLCKTYGGRSGGWLRKSGRTVHAVAQVSLAIHPGRTLGIVGESGSGKSTLARCIARLTDVDGGEIRLGGVDISRLSREAMRPLRQQVQTVFQDPYSSLNPRERVLDIIAKGPRIHGVSEAQAHAQARELLELVGLKPSSADRFPHEFSGGQRQRIGIARALALRPALLIADEPVSALDVSVQAHILALLEQVRERFGLAMLFITHDLRVAAQVCDDVAVMHRGRIVEQGPTHAVFGAPAHAYTRQLLAAVPGREWHAPAPDAVPAVPSAPGRPDPGPGPLSLSAAMC